jgi:DNA gyrase subunit A
LEEILVNEELCKKVIKDELIEVKEKYGDERRSEIIYASEEFNPEDFYADDQMVITISHLGISSVLRWRNSVLKTEEE